VLKETVEEKQKNEESEMRDEDALLFGVIGKAELASFLQTLGGKKHPLKALIETGAPRRTSSLEEKVAINTGVAARAVAGAQPEWLKGLKARLLDLIDATNAASALGEIRAFGDLLQAYPEAVPETNKTADGGIPEFVVAHNGSRVVVEVHTKQADADEAKRTSRELADQMRAGLNALPLEAGRLKEPAVVTAVSVIAPFGLPKRGKPGDFHCTNEISRIASIKQRGHQVHQGQPFVLWLDFQDPATWIFSGHEYLFHPLHTDIDGSVMSGSIWWGLYGERGDTLAHGEGGGPRKTPMAHPGKFAQSPGVSAVVVAMPDGLAVFEHPKPSVPLPAWFRDRLLTLPRFQVEHSWLEFEAGMTADAVRHAKIRSKRAVEALMGLLPQ
jgi:hypothetical protein